MQNRATAHMPLSPNIRLMRLNSVSTPKSDMLALLDIIRRFTEYSMVMVRMPESKSGTFSRV